MIIEQNVNAMIIGSIFRQSGGTSFSAHTTDLEIGVTVVRTILNFLANNKGSAVFEVGDMLVVMSLSEGKQPEGASCN